MIFTHKLDESGRKLQMPDSLNALRKGAVQSCHYFVTAHYPNPHLSTVLPSTIFYLCCSLGVVPILSVEGGFLILLSCPSDLGQSHQKGMEVCQG